MRYLESVVDIREVVEGELWQRGLSLDEYEKRYVEKIRATKVRFRTGDHIFNMGFADVNFLGINPERGEKIVRDRIDKMIPDEITPNPHPFCPSCSMEEYWNSKEQDWYCPFCERR